VIFHNSKACRRTGALLLIGTVLGGWSVPVMAQQAAPTAQPVQSPATSAERVIRSVAVRGNERLEPETVRSYANLQPGQSYSAESLDQALKDLYATELFADVVITGADTGDLVITVRENPVINRIILEGNRRIKDDKILPEIRLQPRQIFTRSRVRADVERIVELYRRQGRFAARVEPKVVQLDQNRVDLVFEIMEGDRSKVRQINIIGNEAFSDDRLRKEMFTRQAGGPLSFLRGNNSYDPDRLAADQQKLRAFYLTEGYADFRVVSALAELTPDRRDFIITYVIEEGPRYRFGTIEAESALRDMTPEQIKAAVRLQPGSWFNARAVEDAVGTLNEMAGNLGYAFADINPAFERDAENRVMNLILRVQESQRVYVERIDIQGNTATRDKVIRREFRLNEGDAFNAIKVKRSQDRLQALGFFQDRLEIKQNEGSAPDRIVLGVDVEEKSTGELQFSAGYSSLERFILALSVAQRNFMGKGQELNAGINYSRYARSVQLGFVEPYLFDRQILLGGEVFRRDFNSFNFVGNQRNRTYSQVSTGGGLRLGFPVTEFTSLGTRYSLSVNEISLDKASFYTDPDDDGPLPPVCDPLLAGSYLCDEIGTRTTSAVGYSLLFDNTDGIRPTRGQRLLLSQDFAGLGGSVRYLRTRGDATKYLSVGDGFVLSGHLEGGYIHPLQASPGPGRDAIRITDRFFGPQMRGFDIRGIGPRILRTFVTYDEDDNPTLGEDRLSDALGGRAYYMGRIELELPTNAQLRGLGLRPSVYVDAGSVFGLKTPRLNSICTETAPESGTAPDQQIITVGEDCPAGYRVTLTERYVGDSPSPRVSVGIGVNWVSPFGPLRLDLAKALIKREGDDTRLFTFNVGAGF